MGYLLNYSKVNERILGTCISTVLLGKEIKMEFYLNLNQKFSRECLL